MIRSFLKKILLPAFILLLPAVNILAFDINASYLKPKAEISFSPRSGSFQEDSTFEVPILINTKGSSINSIEIRINYDKNKLAIVKPSGGVSIIGVWVEPPTFDNTKGTASYVGVIPNGITTSSGLIGTITFRAKGTGRGTVSFSSNSKILLNDGFGTEADTQFNKAEYVIFPKAPDGVKVFSNTHSSESEWYNNNNPVVSWEELMGAQGYSYLLDDVPTTMPDTLIDPASNQMSYENLKDGLWYFHIIAKKNGSWSAPEHFSIKIDKTPPAQFTPEVNYVLASASIVERALVSFTTTDAHSGINHYEVGVINLQNPTTASPIFVEAESPYQVDLTKKPNFQVIVRAVDNAGNIRDQSINVVGKSLLSGYIDQYRPYIIYAIILLCFIAFLIHYLFGHHLLSAFIRAFSAARREDNAQNSKNDTLPPDNFTPR